MITDEEPGNVDTCFSMFETHELHDIPYKNFLQCFANLRHACIDLDNE